MNIIPLSVRIFSINRAYLRIITLLKLKISLFKLF